MQSKQGRINSSFHFWTGNGYGGGPQDPGPHWLRLLLVTAARSEKPERPPGFQLESEDKSPGPMF